MLLTSCKETDAFGAPEKGARMVVLSKITGVEAERYAVRVGAVQRVVTRVVGGAPDPLPCPGEGTGAV